jgi:CSLREA domain-containing protein
LDAPHPSVLVCWAGNGTEADTRHRPGRRTLAGIGLLAIAALLLLAQPAFADPQIFTVNSNGDQADPDVGTGGCDVGGGVCTLRAAIQEANFNSPQPDTIDFAPIVTGQILLTSALPPITDSVTINGPGADQLAIDGANTYRVLETQSPTTDDISGLTFRHGLGPVSGGGTFADAGGILAGGNVTLDHVVVSDNSATVHGASGDIVEALGAGITSGGGTLTLTHSTVADNQATATSSGAGQAFANGGGMELDFGATLHIDHSTISGNDATATITAGSGNSTTRPSGGGIYQAGGTLTVDESTISGNSASGSGGTETIIADFAEGGGIYQDNSASLTLTGSTLSGNSVAVPAGPHEFTAGANMQLLTGGTFQDTIVANPIGGANCSQSATDFTSNGYNLEDDSSPASTCNFTQSTDISGQDPMLGSLADNGGPTQTMKLLAGSPAIDKGKSFGATTDERGTGFPRISDSPTIANAAGGDGSDIGAFERDSVSPNKPLITASSPKSPANNNNPTLKGFAEAGSTVRIYTTANCSGPAMRTGSAASFHSGGLTVHVADNTSTVFHATATDTSANKSSCSNGFTYVEDSKPPNTSIDSVKKSPNYHTAKVFFSSTEAGSTFRCRIDAQPYASCTSPKTFTGLAAGNHTVRVIAKDHAGNVDPTPAVASFTL